MYDLIIIGSGPAGMTAAIYAAVYKLRTLLVGEKPGGYAADAYKILNYPGTPDTSGMELMDRFRNHVKKMQIPIELDEVVNIYKNIDNFEVSTKNNKFSSRTIIVATGSERRKLNIPGEGQLSGKGVAYCATCDAFMFKNKITAVIGGADSALTAALQLAEIAQKVYLIYRRDKMTGLPDWIEKVKNNKKITLVPKTNILKIEGKDKVESIELDHEFAGQKSLEVDGIFIEIGSVPLTTLFKNCKINLDTRGFIDVDKAQKTNVNGLFAAGDVTNGSNQFEQIITASAEGSIAANSVFKYIQSLKNN